MIYLDVLVHLESKAILNFYITSEIISSHDYASHLANVPFWKYLCTCVLIFTTYRYYEGQFASISEVDAESDEETPQIRVTEAAEKVAYLETVNVSWFHIISISSIIGSFYLIHKSKFYWPCIEEYISVIWRTISS